MKNKKSLIKIFALLNSNYKTYAMSYNELYKIRELSNVVNAQMKNLEITQRQIEEQLTKN